MQMAIRWGFGMFVAALLVAGGLALLIAKPKINPMFVYASKLPVKNERNWKFANTVFALTMLFAGALIAVETAVINLLKADIKVFMPVTMVTLAVGLFLMAWLPGVCLKKHLKNTLKTRTGNRLGNERYRVIWRRVLDVAGKR